MPQSINAVGHGLCHLAVGLLVMVPNLIGLCAMILVSRSSSRRAECQWHAALAHCSNHRVLLRWNGNNSSGLHFTLVSRASGLYGFIGPFWSMPGQFRSGRAAAVALAAICSIGNLALLASPPSAQWPAILVVWRKVSASLR